MLSQLGCGDAKVSQTGYYYDNGTCRQRANTTGDRPTKAKRSGFFHNAPPIGAYLLRTPHDR
jgi:hypothetical protein